MSQHSKTIAIIVAAGRGARAGDGGPKQYRRLSGKSVLARTAEAFLSSDHIDAVRVIIHRDDEDLYLGALNSLLTNPKLLPPVFGGAERQDSVRHGLESLQEISPVNVLIHDGARPFVSNDVIDRVITSLQKNEGAIAALPVFDTIKRSTSSDLKTIETTVPRNDLWRAQTPQGFKFQSIMKAHTAAIKEKLTDDAAVAEFNGIEVALVAGSPDNMKITQAEDFGLAETLLIRNEMMHEFRTGQGYDVHAFENGNRVFLCGVEIKHDQKLKGHSDADVGMHALTDAIFGAIGEGDIGDHFPPSDSRWKGAASHIFLTKAKDLVAAKGGAITHCDITLICEAPKISPHRQSMRDTLAKILQIDPARISVKATTTEKLGFEGRREGIAASAIATVKLPTDLG